VYFTLVLVISICIEFSYAQNHTCPQWIGPPCPRNYNNTMPDYQSGDNTSMPQILIKNMTEMLDLYINIILTKAPPGIADDFTVQYGIAGRALIFLKLYNNENVNQTRKMQYLNYARQYIDSAMQHMNSSPPGYVGFLESYTGVLSVAAIIYDIQGETEPSQKFITEVQNAFTLSTTIDTFDEGRAGLLYCGVLLNKYFNQSIFSTQLLTVAYQLVADGLKYGNSSVLQWPNVVVPSVFFIGQGHGSAGVIQTFLEIPELLANQTVVGYIRNTLDYYMSVQFPDGNFPTPLVPPYPNTSDVLVQWCHGAPGFMPLLTRAYQLWGDTKYLASADLASNCTWMRGILTKGLMLCHGVSGNTYQFLYMYNALQNPKYLWRAIKFQEYALSTPILTNPAIMRVPTPSPYAMFDGSYCGAIAIWSDMLTSISNAHMPGFETFI